MPFSDVYAQGHAAALAKFAATRGLKEIRSAVAQGNMGRANMLAQTPGVLNPNNTMGSQIRDFGAGSEGLATLVAHPQHGVAVRKMFDPTASGYSPQLIQRKEQMGSLPGAAAHLGATQTMHNTPVHFNEYVQGQNASRGMTPDQQQQYQRSMLQVQRASKQQGMVMKDLRPENAVVSPQGVKFIDSMPFKPNEVEGNLAHKQFLRTPVAKGEKPRNMRNAILRTQEGGQLFPGTPQQGFDPSVSSANRGQFKQYMFAGNATPPPGMPAGPSGTSLMPPTPTPTPLPQPGTLNIQRPGNPARPPMPPRHTGLSELL